MTVSKPFDYRNADLVLRSGANDPASGPDTLMVEFRVHKCILATASSFFDDMFSLPQAEGDMCIVPVVDVPEDAHTMELLLGIIYPVPTPRVDTLDELVAVLEAACKYDIEVAVQYLRGRLLDPEFVSVNPLRVYAIACRFELDEEARLASQHTLRVKVVDCPLTEDLRHISAYQYHRLLDLHRRRAKEMQELIVYNNEFKCMMCNGTHYGAFIPPGWWKDWVVRAKEELRDRPTTDVIFSMGFLKESARAGCERCAGSIMNASVFLDELKRAMDAIPNILD